MNTNRAGIFHLMLTFAVILLLMLVPAVPAMADDSTSTYTGVSSWADLQKAIDDSSSAKTYLRLNKDVTASSTDSFLSISGGKDIVLELNGKTLSRGLNEDQNDGCVIKIEGGTFTLNDSSANNSGKITGGKTKGATAGGVNVCEGGIFIMNGGTIQNNKGLYYGGVYLNHDSARFTMNGGAIQNNNGFNGGGVSVCNGTFTMSNGKVEGNTAGSQGGGVYLNGDNAHFTMEGGTISGNTSVLSGGGVYITHGTFNMSGGTISGNEADDGGGVNIGSDGTFNMSGGTISDNAAKTRGGGVYIYGTTSVRFTMNDGTISGNTASSHGGGVYVDSAGSFTIKKGTITGNTVDSKANNVYLKNSYGSRIKTTSDFDSSSKIGVTLESPPASVETMVFTSGDYSFPDDTAIIMFTSDNPAYEVYANNGQAALKAVHFNLWVGDDQEVTGGHLSGTGWSFDPWTDTLTLESYSYSGSGHSSDDTNQTSACIYYAGEKDFNLEIKGENSLTNTGSTSTNFSHGIFCFRNLTIKDSTINGKGTLAITSGGGNGAMGIKCEQSIEIQNGTISATGINYGIHGERGVTISGGSVTANGSGNTGIGIHVGTGCSLTIGEHAESVDIIGKPDTIGLPVKNAVKGFGWTNRQGTVEKTEIPISDTSQTLVNYEKIHFPVYDVTFKVSGGAWNDNNTGEKTVTPDLNVNNKQVLSEDHIPAVGNKPDEGYKAGNWDTAPTPGTVITENTTYTYTYEAKGEQTITADDVTATFGDTNVKVEAKVTDPATGGGELSYAVKAGDEVVSVDNTGELTIKKAGTATVTVTAAQTADYKQAAKDVNITIDKADSEVITEPKAKENLTCSGKAQELVIKGEAVRGEMQYALGTRYGATGPYTTSIPTATDAGTYYVWYKVKGEENYNDTIPRYIPVTIENPSTPGGGTESEKPAEDIALCVSSGSVRIIGTQFTYSGKGYKPVLETAAGRKLIAWIDYRMIITNSDGEAVELPKHAGTYHAMIVGQGRYAGIVNITFVIKKAANPMKMKAVKAAADSAKLRKKSQSIPISKLIKFLKKARGKKRFAKVSGNKNITVNKKTGTFTLKKGLQKGTYKVRLKIKAAGNTNYKAAAKTVAVNIVIK